MCTCIYVYNAFNALEVHEESGRVGRRGGEQGGGGRKYMGTSWKHFIFGNVTLNKFENSGMCAPNSLDL